jgi:hypothetical protein
MTQTTDNQLSILASGQADWDSDVDANFGVLERGYHTTARAGVAINSGYVCWMTSGGFMVPFNPNSTTIKPTALAITAPASGDSALFLLTGIVRSLYTAFVPGQDYFVSATTPGMIVGSYAGETRKVGIGLDGGGFRFEWRDVVAPIVVDPFAAYLNAGSGSAGVAINSGYVCWMNSGGFMFPFDPNSATIQPHAISLTAPASGAVGSFLRWGVVRSLYTAFVPGLDYFVSPITPGLVVGSYSAASRKIGNGFDAGGLLFEPRHALPEQFTSVTTIVINPTSEHLFSIDVGKSGVVRDLLMKSNSLDKVGLWFYSNSARNDVMYSTLSGGVTTVASFVDRALWPYDNTDASTLSGLLYGRVFADSGSAVASLALQIKLTVDRVK